MELKKAIKVTNDYRMGKKVDAELVNEAWQVLIELAELHINKKLGVG